MIYSKTWQRSEESLFSRFLGFQGIVLIFCLKSQRLRTKRKFSFLLQKGYLLQFRRDDAQGNYSRI